MGQYSRVLIVGLGNPGRQYEHTRHNVGFRVADALHERFRFSEWKMSKSYYAFVSRGTIAEKQVILAKPYTFMNNSGKAVKRLTVSLRVPPANLFVVHDDLALPIGTMRIAKNRGAAGHRGVQSVIQALGTKDFVRFRIGVGPAGKQQRAHIGDTREFVLQKFSAGEEKTLRQVLQKALEAIELALEKDVARAMNAYN